MTTKISSEHSAVPDWLLERYRLSELPPEQLADVRAVLEREPAARERLAQLDTNSAAILETHPARILGAAIRAKLATQSLRETGRSRVWRPALAVALPSLVVAVGWALWSPLDHRLTAPSAPGVAATVPSDTTRIKGLRPLLLVFRKDGEAAAPMSVGAAARRGDILQLAYQAAGHDYGVILSVDGRGVVTQHFPRAGGAATALRSGGPVVLDTAYRLDDAPRFEAFYFVAADQPFDLAPVIAAAKAVRQGSDALPAASLELPAAFLQTSFVLRKDGSS